MTRTTPRHTAAQYVAHKIAAKRFVECLNAYNDIMTKIQAAKQAVIDSGMWKTFEDCVEEIGEYVTDARQDYLIEDFDSFVIACEAEYPKHGVIISESGLVPEHAAFDAMTKARTDLIDIVCQIADVNLETIMSASIVKQNEFAGLACKAVGIIVEIKL